LTFDWWTDVQQIMPDSLLVTSTSRSSLHLIATLLSLPDCPPIHLLVRPEDKLPPSLASSNSSLRRPPHSIVEVHRFDLRDSEFKAAFEGRSIVYHNGAVLDPVEEATSIAVIDAANAARVRHFIFCSVFQPVRQKLHTHKLKLALEEYLAESRLNFTILQPGLYMQNVPLNVVKTLHMIPIGFSSSIVHGFVDLTDVARVTRTIIMKPEHHNYAQYELVSQNISYDDIARVFSKICRMAVHCQILPIKDFMARMSSTAGFNTEHSQDAIERSLLYYNRWGLAGNSNVLEWLLGHEATKWESYIRRELVSLI